MGGLARGERSGSGRVCRRTPGGRRQAEKGSADARNGCRSGRACASAIGCAPLRPQQRQARGRIHQPPPRAALLVSLSCSPMPIAACSRRLTRRERLCISCTLHCSPLMLFSAPLSLCPSKLSRRCRRHHQPPLSIRPSRSRRSSPKSSGPAPPPPTSPSSNSSVMLAV